MTQQPAQTPSMTVSDDDWKRALDCAHSCFPPEKVTRKELDNAMQHAFGLLSLRVAQTPSRIEALEAAMRRAYDFLQDKSFTPDELTHECTKVLEVMEAALAPEQNK